MNIPALPLQTGEDEEGQTFEIKIIFSAKGWASPPTLHNRAAQGLDVRHLPSPSPCGRGEVFSLDIPFYRTRPLLRSHGLHYILHCVSHQLHRLQSSVALRLQSLKCSRAFACLQLHPQCLVTERRGESSAGRVVLGGQN